MWTKAVQTHVVHGSTVPISLIKINLKRIFVFTKNDKKQNQHSAFVLQEPLQTQRTSSSGLPRSYTQHLSIQWPSQELHHFELCLCAPGLYFYLTCAPISKMYPLGNRFFALCHFGLQRFHRNALLSDRAACTQFELAVIGLYL